MPVFEYECSKCDKTRLSLRTLEKRDVDTPWCFRCQQRMKFILSAVKGFVKNPAAGHTRRV